MITLKKDIINIIQHFIEPKELNIQEYMEIIPSKNSSYMINLKFIALTIKLGLEQQSLLLHLFLDMVVMYQLIDLNIIWIILRILISISIKQIICLIIWWEFLIIKDMFLKVWLILKGIKDLIASQLKVKTFHKNKNNKIIN